jgi:hypothetical protein
MANSPGAYSAGDQMDSAALDFFCNPMQIAAARSDDSLGGFYMSLNIPPSYFAYAMGLFFLCVAWVTNTGMAVWCIRQRQIEQHREWMIRSYVVTFAFVSFRLVNQWLHTYYNQPDNDVSDDLGTAMAWACWAVPLSIAEPLLQMRRVGAA